MTPQERQLVDQLFDRLATLENEPRDPDAERAIRDGARARAQRALRPGSDRARPGRGAAARQCAHRRARSRATAANRPSSRAGSSTICATRCSATEQRRGSGSVPTVRPGDVGSPRRSLEFRARRWASRPAMGAGRTPAGRAVRRPGPLGGAPAGAFGGGGGSFLGTAAAAAAGVIGGSLLLDAIRNVMGPAHAGQGALDPGSAGGFDLAVGRRRGRQRSLPPGGLERYRRPAGGRV